MKKEFKLGLVLGRYNHIHNGHVQIIDLSRKLCEKTLILISSAQECGTLRNPFKVTTRRKAIEELYNAEDVIIGELDDMTNENDICVEWGRYILDNIEKKYHVKPDLMIYGKDESRKGWFSDEDSKDFSEIIISRERIDISATMLREFLVKDDKENWKKYVPQEIWHMYDEFRDELMAIDVYKNRN